VSVTLTARIIISHRLSRVQVPKRVVAKLNTDDGVLTIVVNHIDVHRSVFYFGFIILVVASVVDRLLYTLTKVVERVNVALIVGRFTAVTSARKHLSDNTRDWAIDCFIFANRRAINVEDGVVA